MEYHYRLPETVTDPLTNHFSFLLTGVNTVAKLSNAFTLGFSGWNDIGRSLKNHMKTQQHKQATTTLYLMSSQPPVSALLDKQIQENRHANNEQLVLIIKALRFLSRQNLALRGSTYKKVS